MKDRGSLWQRWDLHVHTPASYEWRGSRFKDQPEKECDRICEDIITQMNSVDVAAFGIMDYWTFDGYIILRKYLERNPNATNKVLFPGIELRLGARTNHRLNTHVIFNNSLSDEALQSFLTRLCIGGPNGPPPLPEAVMQVARTYGEDKLRTHACTLADRADDAKMYLLGLKTIDITRESLETAVKVVGEGNWLFIQPYDTSDGLEGLDWERHPFEDNYLMQMAHIFETRKPLHVRLFLGFGHPTKPDVGPNFLHALGGSPKPVVSGSDAHRIADYGVYPSDRITWLKTQPTFAGLRHLCCEPARRCFIGDTPQNKLTSFRIRRNT